MRPHAVVLCVLLAGAANGQVIKLHPAPAATAAAFTWDPTSPNTNANVVLTNGNRDMTGATAGGEVGARALLPQSSGKYCAEYTVIATPATFVMGIGFADTSYNSAGYLGSSSKSVGAFSGDTTYSVGITIANAAAWTGINAPAPGDVYTICLDFDTGKGFIGKTNAFGAGQDIVAETSPWVTWTPGGTWNFAADAKVGNPYTVRLSATPVYSYTGYTLLNH